MRKIRVGALSTVAVIALALVVQAQAPAAPPPHRARTRDTARRARPGAIPISKASGRGHRASAIPLQRPGVVRHAQPAHRRRIRRSVKTQARSPEGAGPRRLRLREPERPLRSGRWWTVAAAALVRTCPSRSGRRRCIVDPPNGRLPALTPAAQKRVAERRAARADESASYTDFHLTERCITRGLTGSILPGGYNNGNRDRAVARLRHDRQRDDSRIAHRAARRATARRAGDSRTIWATRAATGTATRWWSRRRTSSIGSASA